MQGLNTPKICESIKMSLFILSKHENISIRPDVHYIKLSLFSSFGDNFMQNRGCFLQYSPILMLTIHNNWYIIKSLEFLANDNMLEGV